MLFFFFIGIPGTSVSETQIGNNKATVVETVWLNTYNPVFLLFIFMAGIAVWGCYKNTVFAWVGSLSVLILSILAMFSVGLFTLPGAVLLVTGAALKTFNRST